MVVYSTNRVGPQNFLSVELEDKTEHAVRCGMLRTGGELLVNDYSQNKVFPEVMYPKLTEKVHAKKNGGEVDYLFRPLLGARIFLTSKVPHNSVFPSARLGEDGLGGHAVKILDRVIFESMFFLGRRHCLESSRRRGEAAGGDGESGAGEVEETPTQERRGHNYWCCCDFNRRCKAERCE